MWLDGPIPPELSRFSGYLMARLGQASSRRFAAELEPHGLHPRHFGVMNIIDANPGLSQQALGDRTGIDASTMTALLDELEVKGLAVRRPQPGDRRARAVYLTYFGEETLGEARQAAARLHRELMAPLSAEERQTLHDLLVRLARKSSVGSEAAGGVPGAAAGGPGAAGGVPGAAAGGPDAAGGVPDATAGGPDAAASAPGAATAAPHAAGGRDATITSEAPTDVPDAAPGVPNPVPGDPDAARAAPGAAPAAPDAAPGVPNPVPGDPDAAPAAPDSAPAAPNSA